MGISSSQINFLALTTIQRKVNVSQQSEYDISAKVQSLAQEYQSLINNADDVLNPFNIGDTVTISSRVSSLIPDDTFIGKDGEELNVPNNATITAVNSDKISLDTGDNVVSIDVKDLLTATDKVQYSPDEFLALTGNKALANINFDASEYVDYSIESTAQTTIFANEIVMASSATANSSSKNASMDADLIGAEHITVNNEYNSIKSIIDDDKKSLAFVG